MILVKEKLNIYGLDTDKNDDTESSLSSSSFSETDSEPGVDKFHVCLGSSSSDTDC